MVYCHANIMNKNNISKNYIKEKSKILIHDFLSGSGNLIIHSPIDYEELEQKRLTFDLVVKVTIFNNSINLIKLKSD